MQDRLARQAELVRLGDQITELAAHLDAGEYRFLVLVEAFDREEGWSGIGAEAELEAGNCHAHVPAETSRRLTCDAGVVHWHETADDEPLSVGRKTRTIPPAIRRALNRRDGGCRFPGCSATRFVDAHHVQHWADGGETRMENLVLLCRRHHRPALVGRENGREPGGFGVGSAGVKGLSCRIQLSV